MLASWRVPHGVQTPPTASGALPLHTSAVNGVLMQVFGACLCGITGAAAAALNALWGPESVLSRQGPARTPEVSRRQETQIWLPV